MSRDVKGDLFQLALFLILILVTVILAMNVSAASFITPAMMKRNGLTDRQYEALWKIGKRPQIEQAAAREWMFKSYRFQNVTNWLDICGKTNDFAALSYDLQGKNFVLAATNAVLVATNNTLNTICRQLEYSAKYWWESYTNQLAATEACSNLLVIASAQAEAAQAKINDEIADLRAKIEKYEEYKTKYPLLKTVWTALINDAENRIKILQALTGSN